MSCLYIVEIHVYVDYSRLVSWWKCVPQGMTGTVKVGVELPKELRELSIVRSVPK